jgi:hypothetical protein
LEDEDVGRAWGTDEEEEERIYVISRKFTEIDY